MKFHPTTLATAMLVEPEPRGDDRGSFARTFCRREFEAAGLPGEWVQQNVSHSARRGTVRGMHFQHPPQAEDKLVRCLEGAILDVIVDLRRDSPTYLRHEAFELTHDNGLQLFVPKGFAHGFQTLTDHVAVTYLVTQYYTPEAEGGLRHDDPLLGIRWPLEISTISAKDVAWPLLDSMAPLGL